MTGRTEKERKYKKFFDIILKDDKALIKAIHNKAQCLKSKDKNISDDSCYATATYVYLLKAGYKVSMKLIEDLLGVSKGTISRRYRCLL